MSHRLRHDVDRATGCCASPVFCRIIWDMDGMKRTPKEGVKWELAAAKRWLAGGDEGGRAAAGRLWGLYYRFIVATMRGFGGDDASGIFLRAIDTCDPNQDESFRSRLVAESRAEGEKRKERKEFQSVFDMAGHDVVEREDGTRVVPGRWVMLGEPPPHAPGPIGAPDPNDWRRPLWRGREIREPPASYWSEPARRWVDNQRDPRNRKIAWWLWFESAPPSQAQIGRASCRERVFGYV